MSNYRVVVQYDPERSVFTARAPELGPQCTGEGASRADAVAKVEEEINALVANTREQGQQPPAALDDDLAAFDGTVTAKVSRTLHRDLAFQARIEGVDLAQLVGELVAGALDQRRRERPRRTSGNVQPPAGGDEQPPRRDDRGPRRGGGFGGGRDRDGRYQAIMEDKATFLEYVRGLESGGGQQRGGGYGGGGGGRGQQGPRRDDRGPRRGPPRGPGGSGGSGGQGSGGGGGNAGGGGGQSGDENA